MLRSSGFFRGVECPFGAACGRPYCPFRHPHAALQAALGPATTAAAFPSGRAGPSRRSEAAESGYDPYRPELPKPSPRIRNGGLEEVAETTSSTLELELVNQAIEAVRNEVEREQKKYKELLETKKDYGSPEDAFLAPKSSRPAAALGYTPGGYQNATDYNPTPLSTGAASTNQSSKYTLHPPERTKSKGSSLEYIPTMVSQSKKYHCPVRNNKYTIDSSKPSTDLEYDPLSNYSARLLSKDKRKRAVDPEGEYSPPLKRHCDESDGAEPPACFSDSEEEQQDVSTASVLARSGSAADSKAGGEVAEGKDPRPVDSRSRQMRETAVQYDMGDIESMPGLMEKDARAAKASAGKEAKGEEGSADVSREKLKKKHLEGLKDRKKQHKVAQKEKSKLERRNGERRDEKAGKPRPGGPVKVLDKAKPGRAAVSKGENRVGDKDPGKRSVPEKPGPGKTREGKPKPGDLKAKAESRERKVAKTPLSPSPRKAAAKGSAKAKAQAKQRTLSHADLFGDESEDDSAEPLPSLSFPDVGSDLEGEDGRSLRGLGGTGPGGSRKRPKLARRPPPPSPPSSSSDEVDYSVLEKEMDFESDPMEECLRIFNESTDVKTEDKGRLGKQVKQPLRQDSVEEKAGTEDTLTTLFPGQKRRISHMIKQGSTEPPSKPVIRPYRPPTAQEVCYQRIQLAQEQATQLTQMAQQAAAAMPRGEKKRIAHVPHAALPAPAKQAPADRRKASPLGNATPSNGSGTLALKMRTLAGMASKTTTTNAPKRIAHAPTLQSATLKRPVIPTEFGAKVPTNIRQRYLNLFIDECLKSSSSQQEAFDKALQEEKLAYERSTSRNIYLNVAVNTLKKLRSLLPSPSRNDQKASNHKVVSHEAMLGGKLAAKTSFTLNRSTSLRVENLTGAILYRRLKEYMLSEEELKEHGYPLPSPEKHGRAVVFTAEEKKVVDSSCRICCRCGAEYMVSASGNCVRREECSYHWGKLRKQRVPGGWETHYNCCSGSVGSPGCQVAKQHVHDGRKDKLDNFVKTFEKMPSADGHPGIYALDCEMCYTKQGLELTRVTVIDSELKVVYDTFVQPDSKVVDYNTRFSGVTEADLENATITLRDVQAVLLNMFSADTILIGHSLESDLFALKLIHCTVVDTAVVFPHRLGLPYKRALRTLMADYLKRIIQDSVEGHDSSEDARACMELMIWKIREDAKVKR